jgi:phage terminase small subunit
MAGYSVHTAGSIAHELLKKPEILKRIQVLNDDILDGVMMSKEEALAAMAMMAKFNPQDAYDEHGQLLPIHEMPPEVAMQIKEIERHGSTITSVRFQNDRRAATESLLKHYNAFEDHQKSGRGEINVFLDDKDKEA